MVRNIATSLSESPQSLREMSPSIGDQEVEGRITHFIPSVELKGTLAEKLRKLDTLIAYLEELRHGLTGDTPRVRGGFEGPSRYAMAPTWPWVLAGLVGTAVVIGVALFSLRA